MVAIDLEAGIPPWWVAGDGSVAVFGIVLLFLYRRASRTDPGVPGAGG
jgi:hypothetical protein